MQWPSHASITDVDLYGSVPSHVLYQLLNRAKGSGQHKIQSNAQNAAQSAQWEGRQQAKTFTQW